MDSIIIFGAKDLFVLVVLIWLVVWWQSSRKNRTELAIATIAAGIIAGILDKIAGKIFYDPRPFVTHHLTPLVTHAADNGFPSEHTILTATLAGVLFFYRPKLAGLAFLIAILVGSARVAAHVHSPIDIIGGLVIGLVSGYGGYYLTRNFWSARVKQPQKKDT
jgi:undecaprenyl-diphosphatase